MLNLLPFFFLTLSPIQVCNFNVQFLGVIENREDDQLAEFLKASECDLVVIQELDAPPSEEFLARNHLYEFPKVPGEQNLRAFPSKENERPEPIKAARKSTEFFMAMEKAGFSDFILSEEDTGIKVNHNNGTASEWWVVFYRREKVEPAEDLPRGFLSQKRAGDKPWQRTPYAFPFRTTDKKFDFVLISVHLAPNANAAKRRREEISAIAAWVEANQQIEKDFIVLGDMNIESSRELSTYLPNENWSSLNNKCVATNTNPRKKAQRPYDQVLLRRNFTTTTEIPALLENGEDNFKVLNLVEGMRSGWLLKYPDKTYPGGLPGDPLSYQHDLFRTHYSDHHPIRFELGSAEVDDD